MSNCPYTLYKRTASSITSINYRILTDLIIFQKALSHISTVFGQFSYLNSYVYSSFQKKVYINPQSNPRSGLFLSSNTYYSYLNRMLHLTITDVAKAIQDLCDQLKSLREDVDTLKKRWKSKKSKSRKSYSGSPSCNRCYRSRSRARSISPRSRERSSRPRSGARISHHRSESRSRTSLSRSRSRATRSRSRSRATRSCSHSTSTLRSRSRARNDHDDSRSWHRSYLPPRHRSHSRSRCGTRHSRSRSRTPSKTVSSQARSKNRNWEDIPDTHDYSEHINFDGSDTEAQAGVSILVEVFKEMESLLTEKCTSRLPNGERLKSRNNYALPKVLATKTPSLDGYLKSELSRATKAADKELATISTYVLDALSPLTAIVEADTKGENIIITQGVNAVKAAIELIGNADARISHLRRTKIISQMNKSLLPLTEDDDNFTDAPPTLFGPEFARKSKELVDQMKAMRSSTRFKDKHFFSKWPPQQQGGYRNAKSGRGGAPNFQSN